MLQSCGILLSAIDKMDVGEVTRNRIPNQIDDIAARRLIGCLVKFVLLFLAGMILFALIVRHAEDRGTRASAAFAFGGLVFGLAASILTHRAQRMLLWVILPLPPVASLCMFVLRTLFGMSDELPLAVTVAPLFLSAGFLVGRSGKL
jgi:hypothetical protein